jgi:hypothetical protein
LTWQGIKPIVPVKQWFKGKATIMQRRSYRASQRFVLAALLCLLCSLIIPAQTRRNNRATSRPGQPGIVDIRQIDFRNFTYTLNGRSYRLIDGFYAENIAPNMRWELGLVDGPFYGDLTGDRKDEVVFVLNHGTGKATDAAEVRVYTLQQGRAVLLASFVVKETVDCELDHYIRVGDGMITIERVYGKQGRCDYNEVTAYRWSENRFVPIGASTKAPCRCM